RCLVDHLLRDAGEPLYPAREPGFGGHEALEGLVQLSPADEHRAHLRQLAVLSPTPVRLRVHDQELGGCDGALRELHGPVSYASDPTACTDACRSAAGEPAAG